MFRCNQCPKAFEDHSAIRRHLSIIHFTYSPYLCNICIKTEQFHVTATEDDMIEHFETVHPGTKPSITLSRDKVIEDKIKAVVEECRLPASQSISRNFKNDLHQNFNSPSDQSPFLVTVTEIGPISSHMTQEQTNGETTEIAAENDIEIVYESAPQKVKDEVTTPNDISLGLKNALRLTYDILCDETTVGTSAKEAECFSPEIKQELSNNEATENIIADENEDYNRKMIEKMTVQRESNINSLENSSHVAIEPTIETRQPSSSNESADNLIQRKRTLPMNDRHSRTELSSKRLNPKEKLHKCDQWSYASTKKSQVVLHTRTHTGEKPFKCGHCSYACNQKSSLNIHVRTHSGKKPFKCDRCSFACSQKVNLNKHMRTHTGERPYKCDVCPYASAQSGALSDHMRIHTGERPFKCSLCSYACAHKSHLNSHIRSHTGEKPYKCSECAYACIKSSNLQDHVRRRHSKKTE